MHLCVMCKAAAHPSPLIEPCYSGQLETTPILIIIKFCLMAVIERWPHYSGDHCITTNFNQMKITIHMGPAVTIVTAYFMSFMLPKS